MAEAKTRDLSANTRALFLIWIVPIGLLFGLNFTTDFFGPRTQIGVAAALFAWMGSACTLNALRCHRLHCMIAGPAFLVAAVALALIALDVADFGRDGPNFIIWGTFAIVAFSFLPERMFGRYIGVSV